jgi:ADP-dependent NAD(P)H-hydrate dehydratase / NAD(P)H-hydrate epimerase
MVPMHVALQNDIRIIEEKVQQELKIPMLLLMEQAGAAVALRALAHLGNLTNKKVMIICGTGNNGGDGLAATRHLVAAGAAVSVFMYGDPKEASELTKLYATVIEKTGTAVRNLRENTGFSLFSEQINDCGLVVDALMGIGFKPPATEGISKIIQIVNAKDIPVISIDIPSGIECDTGQAECAIRATETIAMILPKPAHYLQPGASLSGIVSLEKLAVPSDLTHGLAPIQAVDECLAASFLKKRNEDSHKGDFGKTLIVAGSPRYPGAALLAAKGALRSGSGLVYLLDYANTDSAVYLPEVIPANGFLTGRDCTQSDHIMKVLDKIDRMTSLVIGPGLSSDPMRAEAVRYTVQVWDGPIILDADALGAFHDRTELLRVAHGKLIITPHPGEMARLLGTSSQDVQKDRIRTARRAADMWQCTVVLKGAGTVIASADNSLYINTSGNSGMAMGGSGDVLAGLIGGLVSQGYETKTAAALGAYIHGKAGDLAAVARGPVGFTPSETADFIPTVYNSLFQWKNAGKG